MPFGLKNVGATYQWVVTVIFHDMIHDIMEDYVDDILGKSKTREDHPIILRRIFERLREYKVRLNPKKCVFGVLSGKLLGFIMSR
jgi:predicted HD phosphohydrolase